MAEYTLIKPIGEGESKVEKVTIKEEFTGRDFETVGNAGGEGSAVIALVSAATGLGKAKVLNMSSVDVKNIGEIAKPFFAGGEG